MTSKKIEKNENSEQKEKKIIEESKNTEKKEDFKAVYENNSDFYVQNSVKEPIDPKPSVPEENKEFKI